MEHEVWIEAATEHVFDALTTKQGLDRWWGPVITAEPRVGSVVEFDHGLGDPLRMEIARWYGFCNSAWGQTLSVNLKNSVE